MTVPPGDAPASHERGDLSVPRALAWSLSGQVLIATLTFGTSVALARLVVPAEMGAYVLAQAAVGALSGMLLLGVGTHLLRADEIRPATLDTALTLSVGFAAGLAALFLGFANQIGALVGQPAVAFALKLLAAGPLLAALELRPLVLLQRSMRFRDIAFVDAGKVAVNAVTSIGLAAAGEGSASLAWGYLAGGVFGVVAYNAVERPRTRLRCSVAGWRPMVVSALGIVTAGGAAALTARLTEIMLGSLVGLEALGLYSRATGMAAMINDNIYAVVARIMLVQLGDDLRTRGRVRRTVLTNLPILTALFWPALLGLAILARPVISVLYGEAWLGAALPLTCLMIAQALVLAIGLNWELAVIRHETRRQARFEALRAFVGLGAFAGGCAFGLAAAAATRVGDALFAILLYRPHLRRMAAISPAELSRIDRQGILLTASAITPALGLMIATGWSSTTSPFLIAATVAVGGALWLGLLGRLHHPLGRALRHAADQLRQRSKV